MHQSTDAARRPTPRRHAEMQRTNYAHKTRGRCHEPIPAAAAYAFIYITYTILPTKAHRTRSLYGSGITDSFGRLGNVLGWMLRSVIRTVYF